MKTRLKIPLIRRLDLRTTQAQLNEIEEETYGVLWDWPTPPAVSYEPPPPPAPIVDKPKIVFGGIDRNELKRYKRRPASELDIFIGCF